MLCFVLNNVRTSELILSEVVVDFFYTSHNKRFVLLSLSICIAPEVPYPVVIRILLDEIPQVSPAYTSDTESKTEASIEHTLVHKHRIVYLVDIVLIHLLVFFKERINLFFSIFSFRVDVRRIVTQTYCIVSVGVQFRN